MVDPLGGAQKKVVAEAGKAAEEIRRRIYEAFPQYSGRQLLNWNPKTSAPADGEVLTDDYLEDAYLMAASMLITFRLIPADHDEPGAGRRLLKNN